MTTVSFAGRSSWSLAGFDGCAQTNQRHQGLVSKEGVGGDGRWPMQSKRWYL